MENRKDGLLTGEDGMQNDLPREAADDGGASRREFLRSAAIKGALVTLFGAATFDSVMARAMGRVNEVQAAHRIGAGAADRLHQSPEIPVCPNGSTFKCIDYTCTGQFDCVQRVIDCVDWFDCADIFNCTDHKFGCTGTIDCTAPHIGCEAGPNGYFCDRTVNEHYYSCRPGTDATGTGQPRHGLECTVRP
jgi:hypothetical protein